MNPSPSSDSQEAAHLEKLRTQISTDIEAMQQQETSLKEYEQRLRLLVEQAHSSPLPQKASQVLAPSGTSQASLDSEWEKYERAHALLEAARRGVCDERMALKEREEIMRGREEEVSRREGRVNAREQELATPVQASGVASKPRLSFTQAPFLAARKLFTTAKSN